MFPVFVSFFNTISHVSSFFLGRDVREGRPGRLPQHAQPWAEDAHIQVQRAPSSPLRAHVSLTWFLKEILNFFPLFRSKWCGERQSTVKFEKS